MTLSDRISNKVLSTQAMRHQRCIHVLVCVDCRDKSVAMQAAIAVMIDIPDNIIVVTLTISANLFFN